MSLQKHIISICREAKMNFTLNDRPITFDDVFSDVGLFPAIVRRADQLSSLCLGYGLGASFDEVEQSTLGVKVAFDDVTPEALRLLCIIDVVYELVNMSPTPGGPTPVDELMYD
jgi:intracellular multiplication protein IcmS